MMKSVSLHPKLAAVLDLFINIGMLWWLRHLHSWTMVWVWLAIRVAIWAVFIWRVYYPKEMKPWKHLLSLVIMIVGALAFLLFIEWRIAWFIFSALFSFFSFYSFWLLPASHVSLSVFLKPHLRWRFVMSIIGLAGIFEVIQAIISFQIFYNVKPLVWMIFGSLCAAIVASWWWWEYGTVIGKRFWLWSSVWFVFMLELFWVVNLLPLGYLASSLILIWCWYTVWLLARFNLTSEGINWRRQMLFVGVNLFLFVIFIFFLARWR
jgi:hypothetical protein